MQNHLFFLISETNTFAREDKKEKGKTEDPIRNIMQ